MFLDRIVATKKEEVNRLAETFRLEEAERNIAKMPACLGFERALAAKRKREVGLIAEVKKASPSKGLIRPDFHPVEIARSYEAAGTDCISVLTDETYFQGSNDYLTSVRRAVGVPILRKDFTIDARQIYEARLIGADAILLIAAILTPSQIAEYIDTAKSIGLDALVEVHDSAELEAVLELNKATLIGINNRNLHTFETDLRTTERLIGQMPDGVTIVSESGIAGPEDIEFVRAAGAHAVLIGEHFMRQPVVAQGVTDLLGPVRNEGGVRS
ncbi:MULTISPECIES: indole-3-glycerol phosphate synthase TrpC [unclassified Paenibacillus]|uniref:indole-3-glycerol phosphate synthase TrpC n=1 Tax=unclassified Paenibacillus TaxID=185978 RepID=UPI001C0FFAF1|nr:MULTISPECIES: indole-3-glycerol phosphate synthase TrpC [unclassified Paenibacillus]MBU5443977.1 indole-3-glycerol phosphate synthase TrpC [Paenibacillus sp. MSJ-34]CAH0118758.1 Indole-3-glycerol phosphate synthase [Paenibacillus sp. CECT 9249]